MIANNNDKPIRFPLGQLLPHPAHSMRWKQQARTRWNFSSDMLAVIGAKFVQKMLRKTNCP